jgi:hypothetical protein
MLKELLALVTFVREELGYEVGVRPFTNWCGVRSYQIIIYRKKNIPLGMAVDKGELKLIDFDVTVFRASLADPECLEKFGRYLRG